MRKVNYMELADNVRMVPMVMATRWRTSGLIDSVI